MKERVNSARTVLLALFVTAVHASAGRFDPCVPAGRIAKGGGFYVGVAFWAGGSIEDWGPVYDIATNFTGLHPCQSSTKYNGTGLTDQQYLVQHGVVFRTYEVHVDRMTVLRGNVTEEDALFANLTATSKPVISVVVFRGSVRSEPRYLRSQDAEFTGVKAAGKLQSFLWSDVTCDSCGGRNTSHCMAAQSYDAVQYSCSTAALNCTARCAAANHTAGNSTVGCAQSLDNPCSPSLYLGFAGDDKHRLTFQSGYQIQRINQFSLIAYYQRASSALKNLYDSISNGGLGSGVNDGGVGGSGGGSYSGQGAA